MNAWKMELAMGAALVGNNFLPIPLKISFHMKIKKWLVAAQKLQIIKTLLTLKLSQHHAKNSTFPLKFPQASQ